MSLKKIYFIFIFSLLLAGNYANAALLKSDTYGAIGLQASEASGAYEQADIYTVIQNAINGFLSIIGIMLIIYMLYAGFHWMTAQGEEEKVEKAKHTIQRAIIGAIIIVGAYAISTFVIGRLEQGTLRSGSGAASQSSAPAN